MSAKGGISWLSIVVSYIYRHHKVKKNNLFFNGKWVRQGRNRNTSNF